MGKDGGGIEEHVTNCLIDSRVFLAFLLSFCIINKLLCLAFIFETISANAQFYQSKYNQEEKNVSHSKC